MNIYYVHSTLVQISTPFTDGALNLRFAHAHLAQARTTTLEPYPIFDRM